MRLFPVLPIVMASVCLTVAVSEFTVKINMKGRRYGLAFGFVCLGGFLYNVTCAGVYSAGSAQNLLFWTRFQAIVLNLNAGCLLWFLFDRTRAIHKTYLLACCSLLLLGAVLQAIGLGNLTWIESSTRYVEIPFLFGLDLGYLKADPGPLSLGMRIGGLAFLVFLFIKLRVFFHDNRRDGGAIYFSLGLIFIAYLNDFAIRLNLYNSIYFEEHSWLLGVIFMGVRRSRTVLEAATAKEALQASEEKFRSLIEESSEAIILTDERGIIVEFNRAAERLFGAGGGELIGTGVWQVIQRFAFSETPLSPDSVEAWFREFSAKSEPKPLQLSLDAVLTRLDGEQRKVQIDVFSIRTRNRLRFGGIGHDVTEMKKAEEKLLASLEEKDVLLKEIHHRVKNNLQLISSLLYLQGFRLEEGMGRTVLRDCRDQVHSMALIHEDLYRSNDFRSVDFGNCLRSLTNRLLATYGKSCNARIAFDLEDLKLGMEVAIPCGLIANELCVNALRHAFPPSWEFPSREIRIGFGAVDSETALLTVRDNGVGLPEAFDPKKVDSFGMKLITRLADQIGGSLRTENREGANILVKFPIRGMKV